jgi:3-oxoadipate enol-lactonase/4-carboxymuconolactone decarboxylase
MSRFYVNTTAEVVSGVVTVVLCGSLGSTAEMWDAQTARLTGAVVVEHPGHGMAPLVDSLNLDLLAQRVLAAVAGSFSFVGLSLGGAVGMRVAAVAPERVEKLVLACTATRFGDRQQWLDRAATVRAEGLEAIVDGVMARWFTPAYGDVSRWREMFLSVDREGYARCCEALADWDGADDLPRIEADTLVIAAAQDPTAPPAQAPPVPGARFEVIDGAAHLANVEAADAFNRLVEEQLRA